MTPPELKGGAASAASARPGLRILRRLGALALHALWPVSCPVCGRLGEVLCSGCRDALFRPLLPRCLYCGAPSPCKRHANAPLIRTAALYEGGVSRVILGLKYGGFRALGRRLGEGMAALWEAPAADLLLPVPLHRGSRRGYNQAFEIAKGLGRAWGVRAEEAARWAVALAPRTGLSRAERLSLRPEAFEVFPRVRGARVVLVDDVCTTGATLACLARACEAAGASVLGAFVAAGSAG